MQHKTRYREELKGQDVWRLWEVIRQVPVKSLLGESRLVIQQDWISLKVQQSIKNVSGGKLKRTGTKLQRNILTTKQQLT